MLVRTSKSKKHFEGIRRKLQSESRCTVCTSYTVVRNCGSGDEPDMLYDGWGYYSDFSYTECYANSCCGSAAMCCIPSILSNVPAMSPSNDLSMLPTDITTVPSVSSINIMSMSETLLIGLSSGILILLVIGSVVLYCLFIRKTNKKTFEYAGKNTTNLEETLSETQTVNVVTISDNSFEGNSDNKTLLSISGPPSEDMSVFTEDNSNNEFLFSITSGPPPEDISVFTDDISSTEIILPVSSQPPLHVEDMSVFSEDIYTIATSQSNDRLRFYCKV